MAYVTLFKLQVHDTETLTYLRLLYNTEELLFTFSLLDKNNDPMAEVTISAERGNAVLEEEIRITFIGFVSGFLMDIFDYRNFLYFSFNETYKEVHKTNTFKTLSKIIGDNEKFEVVMDHLSRLVHLLIGTPYYKI